MFYAFDYTLKTIKKDIVRKNKFDNKLFSLVKLIANIKYS